MAWAKKLTLKNGDETQCWGFWTNLENLGGTMWHWIWLNDGKLFSEDGQRSAVDHPNTVGAIQYLADMINVHGVAPPNHRGNGRSAFLKNQLGMVVTHSGFVGQLQSANIGFVTIPGPPGSGKEGGRYSGASDSVMMILDSTKHPDVAWQFVRWLAIEMGVDLASQRNLIPLAAKGLGNKCFQQAPWSAFATSIMTYRPENYYSARVSSRNCWGRPGLLQETISAIMRREVAAEPALQELARVVTANLQSALDK